MDSPRAYVRAAGRVLLLLLTCGPAQATAQPPSVTGIVQDETGGALPGVVIVCRGPAAAPLQTETNSRGYHFDHVEPGLAVLSFGLVNFATARRHVEIPQNGYGVHLDVTLHLSLNADVTVTGKSTSRTLLMRKIRRRTWSALRSLPVRGPSQPANSMRAR